MSLFTQLEPVRNELKEIENIILDIILGNSIVTFPDSYYFPDEIKYKIDKWYQEKIYPLFPEKKLKNLIFYRISLGKKVAEIKFGDSPEIFTMCPDKENKEELFKLITHEDIEEKILERITNYMIAHKASSELAIKVKKMYQEIILVTKNYQVFLIYHWLQ